MHVQERLAIPAFHAVHAFHVFSRFRSYPSVFVSVRPCALFPSLPSLPSIIVHVSPDPSDRKETVPPGNVQFELTKAPLNIYIYPF